MKLRFAPTTERFVENFKQSIPHATLLTGRVGTGLFTLANHLATSNGRVMTIVKPESKTSTSLAVISAARIRQLYIETKSRLDGAHFVIIDDADMMNHVAQNALLKLLEEPNPSIHFILTSHASDKLLPTIRSRAQIFSVAPISTLESKRLLASAKQPDTLSEQRLLYVADGLPAELNRLTNNDADFKALAEQVQKARQFVEGNVYQKLVVIQTLKDDRQAALQFIETLLLLLRKSIGVSSGQSIAQLIDMLLEASEAIRANGNIRLHLFRAVL